MPVITYICDDLKRISYSEIEGRLVDMREEKMRMKKSTPSEQKKAKLKNICCQYGIDQLEVASKEEYKQLNAEIIKLRRFSKELVLRVDVIDLRKLKNRRNKDVERKKYKELYKDGFKSIIRMTCPISDFFDFLSEYNHIFGVYRIWLIEIYKDILLD